MTRYRVVQIDQRDDTELIVSLHDDRDEAEHSAKRERHDTRYGGMMGWQFEVRDGDGDELMTQSCARREAQRLRETGVPAIAVTEPRGAWGGTERGWTVEIGGQ